MLAVMRRDEWGAQGLHVGAHDHGDEGCMRAVRAAGAHLLHCALRFHHAALAVGRR